MGTIIIKADLESIPGYTSIMLGFACEIESLITGNPLFAVAGVPLIITGFQIVQKPKSENS